MARLCIRVAPNAHPTDPTLTPLRTQPGDVVAVVEDGHVFSAGERTSGEYRIIDVPGVAEAALTHLIEHVTDAEGDLARVRRLTLNAAVLGVGPWKNRITATKAQIDSITVTRAL